MPNSDSRYPLGPFRYEGTQSPERRAHHIDQIAELPRSLRLLLEGRTEEELDRCYRSGGWSARQVVHHIADSHANAYLRFRLALTEDTPTIKPYDEARWAELPDSLSLPPGPSLAIIEGLHARWVTLLRELGPEDFAKKIHHPEHGRTMSLDELLSLYAWHGRHHAAHIATALGVVRPSS